jgi:ABC-type antimicrobial peptide transport system permease subunit
VVGVAKDTKYEDMREPSKSVFYLPLLQKPSSQVSLLVRTRLHPTRLATAVGREVRALDPALPPRRVVTMREFVNRQTAAQQFAGQLLCVFGALALLLAVVGLYGLMSYTVSQGGRELSLRLTLGGTAGHLLRLVLARGGWLTAVGLALGVPPALVASRSLGSMLYATSPYDVRSFALACVVTGTASFLACLVPAWRASRIAPLAVLRN